MGFFWQRRPIFLNENISTANSTGTKFVPGYINYFGASSGAKTYHLPAPVRGQFMGLFAFKASTASTKTKVRASTVSNTATVTIASSAGTKQSLLFQKAGQHATLFALSTAKWICVEASPNLTATSS